MAELTVKSKFFGMEDKVEVEGVDETLAVGQRFNKVYVDAIPEEVLTSIAYHFDDTNKKVTLTKEELKNYYFANTLAFKDTAYSVFVDGATKYGEITFTYSGYTYNSRLIFIQPYTGSQSSNVNNTVIKVDTNKKFVISPLGKTTFSSDFDNSLIMKLTDANYSDFKQAVIKDLLINLGYVVVTSEKTVDNKIEEAIGSIAGGTQLYKHRVVLSDEDDEVSVIINTTSSTPYASMSQVKNAIDSKAYVSAYVLGSILVDLETQTGGTTWKLYYVTKSGVVAYSFLITGFSEDEVSPL